MREQIVRESGIDEEEGIFSMEAPRDQVATALFRFGQALTKIHDLTLFDMPIPGRLCPIWAESILCCIPIGRWTRGPYGGGFRLAAQRAGRARHRFRLAFDVEDRMRKLPDGQKAQAWNVQIMRVAGGAARQLLADPAAGWRRSSRSAFAASSFPT